MHELSESTLSYLDRRGKVSFWLVPWEQLHRWLSELNGNINVTGTLPPEGVNRGKVLDELESRRLSLKKLRSGNGMDWREYTNDQGYTHLEELLIYQPKDWRIQAREYVYRYQFNIFESPSSDKRITRCTFQNDIKVVIPLANPTLVVLFHPDIPRIKRYEPLNFLLAYGVENPIPGLLELLHRSEEDNKAILEEMSPLDYFFEFQNNVIMYELDQLIDIGKEAKLPRLPLLTELDFSDIIGQRLAKYIIRDEVYQFIYDRTGKKNLFQQKPLSMIFAGPSGVGKTEMAMWLAELLNEPNDDAFLKVDCAQVSDKTEVFGKAGAYQGAHQGSVLNNFIVRKSQEPRSIGIVLLDEIEKAEQCVIHALYQALDKGEWTNKKLQKEDEAQTGIVRCNNIIFIMTSNSATKLILDQAKRSDKLYTACEVEEVDEQIEHLENRIQKKLQATYPFTNEFMGRIGRIVPFLPLSKSHPSTENDRDLLLEESMTVAKVLIENEQEKLTKRKNANVQQLISPKNKHEMARLVVEEAIPEGGVRQLQKHVERRMGKRMKRALVMKKGGINRNSMVSWSVRKEENAVDFRVLTSTWEASNNSGAHSEENNGLVWKN